jgi:hypothetical protein
MSRLRHLFAIGAVLLGVLPAQAGTARIFDPTQDPAFALSRLERVAMRAHKNILLDLGGDWCASCMVLDRALHTDPRLEAALAASYVLLHVNVSPDNLNRGFLSRFPAATGYPFVIVLSPDGRRLLHAQDGSGFQRGRSPREGYDPASIAAFLARWAPPHAGAHQGPNPFRRWP